MIFDSLIKTSNWKKKQIEKSKLLILFLLLLFVSAVVLQDSVYCFTSKPEFKNFLTF